MDALTKEELAHLAALMAARKERLLQEIHGMLAGTSGERYANLVGEAGDAGDESVASLLRDVSQAEVTRDVLEVRDIVAAENRIAAGRYGLCIDCGAFIGFKRLEAYPSAKRCFECQQIREKTRASTPHSSL